MVNHSPDGPVRARLFDARAIARDYALLVPGFPLSIFAFAVLVPLTAISISTFVVWIGALLLPITLHVASGFAAVSRARVRAWGAELPAASYAPPKPGIAGLFHTMGDARRWLDLAFETLVALPLRACTFSLAIGWSAAALGQVTYPFWGLFLPQDNISLTALVLEWVTGGTIPDEIARSYGVDAVSNFAVGGLLLLTLPAVLRGLARLEVAATTAALGRKAPGASWGVIVSCFFAVSSIAVGWPILSAIYDVPVVVAMCIVLAHAAAMLTIARLPLLGIVLQAVAVLATLVATAGALDLPWPWPVTTLIFQSLLTLLISLRRTLPWAIAAWLVPQAVALIAAIALGITSGARVSIIVSAAVSLGVLVVCSIVRQLVTSRGALQAERRTSADLSAQSKELAERNRIAQELHDVVAHSMSVISVQATTAKYRLPGIGPEAEREFESIAASSRQALAEMRSLLTLLRSNDEDRKPLLAPQPTLTDIPALIESTRQSGVSIDLRMTRFDEDHSSAPIAVPAAIGLTAYRIVQEALSNAMRHSPGASVEVRIAETEHEVSLAVHNGPVNGSHLLPAAPGAGLGLAGVRERAGAVGGSVQSGPDEAGGYSVLAVLPLG